MRKEIRKIKQQEFVAQMVEKDVDIFITSDGKEFTKEEEAIKHEDMLSIPKKYYDGTVVDSGLFYYLKKEEDIRKAGYGYALDNGKIDINKFSFPGWYIIKEEDWDNGYSIYVYSLNEVKESLIGALESLPEGTDD